ncbi:exo-beta-N-acetylmuramidase NamZ domain-containing protein [Granulicella cerasi]|uniref:Exo-beta-N-acetylmuramidase NamZ domain-containing protein n=2 Tax=Granulicella cerasi TaxID=741063 RepID=A0ABW1Z4U7_9BACT
MHLGPLTIPHIAFTWYVLIGAIATFIVGALASMIKPNRTAVAALLLLALGLSSVARAQAPANFSAVDKLVNDAIAEHKLPGAVVVVGHRGQIAYEHTYGLRKLDGEPGLDGMPAPAEAMTEDTIFDMASLTKVLATTSGILHLVDEGKVDINAPVERYLPAFNATHDAVRATVTVKMLLLHVSGEAPDIALKDGWGLTVADKEEGLRRALTTPLMSKPNTVFRYSDINFILLGDIIETITHEPEDVYVQENIFKPLGMTETRYLPAFKACGPHKMNGVAIASAPAPKGHIRMACPKDMWSTSLLARIAPTAHDDEGSNATNPDFDKLLRGTVHDPTTRRMGGVAGHAGVFSTAHDTALFAQALLDKLLRNTGPFPVSQATLRLATSPQQPDTLEHATILTSDLARPLPSLKPVQGLPVHGLGWDINTAFSRNRGAVFATTAPSQPSSPTPSFGHTGFTGTSLWIDPNTDSYVILLSNGIHPHVSHPLSTLRGDVATAAALALAADTSSSVTQKTQLGIDVLQSTHFDALKSFTHIGLLTNQTGLDSQGKRTVDVLNGTGKLVKIFTPEHGLLGVQDTTHLVAEKDTASGLPVISLYGAGAASRHPSHEQLKDLDAVVLDIQDVGVHFYTYESVLGYFLEASAAEQKDFNHKLTIVVLDRPNPVGGGPAQGPFVDAKHTSYVAYAADMPSRHGLTLGELAQYFNRNLHAPLEVVKMNHWTRTQYFDETGLPWHNPSPNLRSVAAVMVYPGIGLTEQTNISVGRGSDTPFEQIGAPWINARQLADALIARNIPGVRIEPTQITIAEDANKYPFHGQTIPAVHFFATDRDALDSPRLGVEILCALHRLYPNDFKVAKAITIVANDATLAAIEHDVDPTTITSSWNPQLAKFNAERKAYELY